MESVTPRHTRERIRNSRDLTKSLPSRATGVTLSAWIARVRAGKYDEALRLHQRYRFDPKGLDVEQRVRLRELCRAGT